MTEVPTVDTRGLSCPQPAMLARNAMQDTGCGQIEIMVDAGTAHQNVLRLAENMGWAVAAEPQPDGTIRLVLTK